MDWYPPPRSGVAGIDRLLVSQVLLLTPRAPRVRWRPLVAGPPAGKDYGATIELLQRALTTTLRNIAGRHADVWLPLTGGLDSRVLLASAHAARVPAQTFTQARQFPTMSQGDRQLPPRLAAHVGFRHRLIEPRRSAANVSVFDEHTGRSSVDQDRWFYAHGQWDDVPPSAIVLRGGVFEVGRAHYYGRFPTVETDDLAQTLASGFRFHLFHATSFAHVDGVSAWLDWIHEHPEKALDWRDRLYLEQRVGGWLSATEQALDLVEAEMVNPAASHRYLAAALSLPPDVRRRGLHHIELVRRMAPELLAFPFNPPDPYPMRLARKARAQAQALSGALIGRVARIACR